MLMASVHARTGGDGGFESSALACAGARTLNDLRALSQDPVFVALDVCLQDVVDLFDARPDLTGVIVKDGQGGVLQVISHRALADALARRYFRELFLAKPIEHLLPSWNVPLSRIDSSASVPQTVQWALERPAEYRYEPVLVDDPAGVFLLDLFQLLTQQCQQLSSALHTLEQQGQAILASDRERQSLHERLVSASRYAGMAEIATSVLHNVGNVLNSVNVSASMIGRRLKESRVQSLGKAADLIHQHEQDLADFLQQDSNGRQLPAFLIRLASMLVDERDAMITELQSLLRSVEHIQHIVSAQQSITRNRVVVEQVEVKSLCDDALAMNVLALQRHHVTVEQEHEALPPIRTDRHLVVQILVNLISNAKKAVRDSGRDTRVVKIASSSASLADGRPGVRIEVTDNGVGIAPEHLTQLFNHGFTTRADGHGFGLHSAANDAQRLGGAVIAASDGPGQGATFTLLLPLESPGAPA